MKKFFPLIILCLFFIACNTANTPEKDNTNNQNSNAETNSTNVEKELYPSLKIENNTTGSNQILSVSLVNYDFSPLGISSGKSQTFILDKGMPGGYEHILVVMDIGIPGQTARNFRIYKNFENGQATVIQVNSTSGGGIEVK